VGEIRNAEGGKPEGKRLLARTRHRREENIKVDSKYESHIRCWVDTRSVVDAAKPHSSCLGIIRT
jgi:hypothetical protein